MGQVVIRRMLALLTFWYNFVVGDDWLVASGILVALVLTYTVSRTTVPAWWVIPVAVGTLLPVSLHRLTRRQLTRHQLTRRRLTRRR